MTEVRFYILHNANEFKNLRSRVRIFESPYEIGIIKMLNVLVRYRYTQVVHHFFREYPHFSRMPQFPGRLAFEGQ